ncbi:unnamed protein product [Withania somnifera]
MSLCSIHMQYAIYLLIGTTHEKENAPGERIIEPRVSTSVPNALAGEQIAAGWPAWLVAAGTEAIDRWLPRKLESFHMLDKVGEGTYSSIYKARDLELNKVVALKRLKFDNVKLMIKEINILRRLDHQNVIKLEGLITTSSNKFGCLYLIFEYMEHDLKGLVSLPGVIFSESQIKCYMKQLLDGINHVHSRGIIHRDITTLNLLVDNYGIQKIADFGLSKFSRSKPSVPLTSRVGTLRYRPPELLIGSCFYGVEVDLWSIGCVLGELFNGKAILQVTATIFKQKVPYNSRMEEAFCDFPVAALELMQTLLSIEPQCRGTAATAMDHGFFYVQPLASDPSSLPKYPPTKEEVTQIYKMSESRKSSEEEANKDKGKDHLAHNFWSFIKGKKKQNHVPRRINSHDIKGKKQHCGPLPAASNQNDHEFKGKKSNFSARLPAESNSMDVDQLLREHDRHIQEIVERAKIEKKMRPKVQT